MFKGTGVVCRDFLPGYILKYTRRLPTIENVSGKKTERGSFQSHGA